MLNVGTPREIPCSRADAPLTARLLRYGAELLAAMGELPPVHVYTTTQPVDGCQLHIRTSSGLAYVDQQKVLDVALSTLFRGNTDFEVLRHNSFQREARITNKGVSVRVVAGNSPTYAASPPGFTRKPATDEIVALIGELADVLTSIGLTGGIAASVQDTIGIRRTETSIGAGFPICSTT